MSARWRRPRGLGRFAACFCVLGLACGCTRITELLPLADGGTESALPICPTRIDVYGGANVMLTGCAGSPDPPASLPDGYLAVGTTAYDSSLAGRLNARLGADADLVPRFGTSWTVRSCATPAASLPQLVPPLPADQCGDNEPLNMGSLVSLCESNPAPVLLLAADASDDRCHGGGSDSQAADDEATYLAHFAQRLDAFLAFRSPGLALIAPRPEWYVPLAPNGPGGHPGGPTDGPPGGANWCQWTRSGWNRDGLARWQDAHSFPGHVVVLPDQQDQFKPHSNCCLPLALTCAASWYTADVGSPPAVNCDGAQFLVDFWYARLKQALLARTYTCP